MRRFLLAGFLLFVATFCGNAQFSSSGFDTSNFGTNSNTNTDNDTTSITKQFSFKQYFNALGHKDTMKISWSFGGSILLPGTAQIYNRDYWKLPIIYAGIGGLVAGGVINHQNYIKTDNDAFKSNSNYFFIGAAVIYWASLFDGAMCYETPLRYHPGKATVYSILLPGLGQAYNGDYWHIPIWYAALGISGYCWDYYGKQYIRYKKLYNQATTTGGGYDGNISTENLLYYRNTNRRFRDYSILATIALYLLQVIDANVFATMNDFDVTDDLSVDISPAIISPIAPSIGNYNFASLNAGTSYGLQLNITF